MCLSPKRIGKLTVSCGHCSECLRKYINDWKQRAYFEYDSSSCVLFFTMTYDDKHLPYSEYGVPYARYRDIQCFFKRLRHKIPQSCFRYMVCSEFGTDKDRPHWHGLLFFHGVPRDLIEVLVAHNPPLWSADKSWSKSMNQFFESVWQNGIVRFSFCKSKAAVGYCVKYMDIKGNMSRHAYALFNQIPLTSTSYVYCNYIDPVSKRREFGLFERVCKNPELKKFEKIHRSQFKTSKSFGLSFVTDARKDFYNSNLIPIIHIGNYHYSMCRYYREKIFSKGVLKILSRRTEEYQKAQSLKYRDRAVLVREYYPKEWRFFGDTRIVISDCITTLYKKNISSRDLSELYDCENGYRYIRDKQFWLNRKSVFEKCLLSLSSVHLPLRL